MRGHLQVGEELRSSETLDSLPGQAEVRIIAPYMDFDLVFSRPTSDEVPGGWVTTAGDSPGEHVPSSHIMELAGELGGTVMLSMVIWPRVSVGDLITHQDDLAWLPAGSVIGVLGPTRDPLQPVFYTKNDDAKECWDCSISVRRPLSSEEIIREHHFSARSPIKVLLVGGLA